LPPPVHGSATISSIFANSYVLNSIFDLKILPLHYAKSMKDLGGASFDKIFKMFFVAIKMIGIIRSFSPVAVYFTITPFGFGFYRDVLFVTIFKIFRIKIIYHLHMKGVKEASENNILKRGLYRYIFKNTYVITLSKLLSLDISSVYERKPFIVNNGLPLIGDDETISQKEESDTAPRLLFLSNFMRAKGIFIFLEAIKILRDRKHKFYAHIVGSQGDVRVEEMQKYITKNNLEEHVVIEGPKYDMEKYKLLSKMDIFVHPTLNDAFPLVILEAMQFQLPVISTYEGAISEIVDDSKTGFLVQKNDLDALVNKIELLLTNGRMRIKMGMKGRMKFLSDYTSNRMEQNLSDVLLKILNSNSIK
jgi:glycosyltransferase involved in cell wall biosynthesis